MDTLLHANAALASFALHASIKASALILLVLLLQRLMARHLSAHARYFLWVAVVAGLVTPIGITVEMPRATAWMNTQMDVGVQSPVTAPTPQDGSGSLALPTDMRAIPGQPLPGSGWISLDDALAAAWLAGALLFLAAVLFRQLRFTSVVRAATPADPVLQSLLDECRQLSGCRRNVQLLCTDAIETPLLTGWFHPRLLIPFAVVKQLNTRQLRHVFVHELMHVRHHDIAFNWLLVVVHAAHWFNPLVWIGFRGLHLDRELARDVAALNYLADDREQYGRTLLQLSQPHYRRQQMAGALGVVDDHAQLHRRILMITRGARPSRLKSGVAILLLLLLGVLAFSRPVFHDDSATPDVAAAPVTTTAPRAAIHSRRTIATAEVAAHPATHPIAVSSTRRAMNLRSAVAASPVTQIAAGGSSGEAMLAAAAEPEAAVAAQQVGVPEEIAGFPAAQTSDARAQMSETYRDWSDIQSLARAAEEGRTHGVNSVTDWNQLAERCHSSGRNSSECSEVYRLITSGQVWSFWSQCSRFIKTYNRLAVRFSRARPAEFVDRAVVGRAMDETRRTLSEFCNTDVYQQKYPEMPALIRASAQSASGASGVNPFWSRPQYVAGAVTFEPPYSRTVGPANYSR